MIDNGKVTSNPGVVTLVPPSGVIVGSDFLLSSEGWSIVGNKLPAESPVYEAYSRGPLLNRYVYGSDDKINLDSSSSSADKSLWFFSAPAAFLGQQGAAYGGYINFNIGAFSGNFNHLNALSVSYLMVI